MGLLELLILAIGVSMDAFAVSVCKGLCSRDASSRGMLACGVWFGGFQALMPLLGFALGSFFAHYIHAFDHWLAFGLLTIIGINMMREAFGPPACDSTSKPEGDFSFRTMSPLAIATSIDALAVGVSLAMVGNVNIWLAILFIGAATFTISALGVKLGSIFGSKYEKKAQIAGGLILIAIGGKILIEHLINHQI